MSTAAGGACVCSIGIRVKIGASNVCVGVLVIVDWVEFDVL